jgi:hypothetical protein
VRVKLPLLGWFLLLAALAAIFRVWAGFVVAVILALALFPQVIVAVRAAVKGQPQPKPRLYLPVSLSAAQQSVAAMVLIGVPVIVWRVVEDGWVAVAIYGPLLAVWVLWMVTLVRREGWRGQRASRD